MPYGMELGWSRDANIPMWVGPINIVYGNMPKFVMDFWFHMGVKTRNLGRQSFLKNWNYFLSTL
jgi:hypothetical protein